MNRFDTYTVKQVDSTVYPGKYFVPDHACCIKEAIESQAYPEGTTVKITYPEIKPEPEVVYPEGARWDEDGNLYSGEGACIGWEIDSESIGYFRPYVNQECPSYCREKITDHKKAKDWVVNQLAKHRHYGFRFKGEG